MVERENRDELSHNECLAQLIEVLMDDLRSPLPANCILLSSPSAVYESSHANWEFAVNLLYTKGSLRFYEVDPADYHKVVIESKLYVQRFVDEPFSEFAHRCADQVLAKYVIPKQKKKDAPEGTPELPEILQIMDMVMENRPDHPDLHENALVRDF